MYRFSYSNSPIFQTPAGFSKRKSLPAIRSSPNNVPEFFPSSLCTPIGNSFVVSSTQIVRRSKHRSRGFVNNSACSNPVEPSINNETRKVRFAFEATVFVSVSFRLKYLLKCRRPFINRGEQAQNAGKYKKKVKKMKKKKGRVGGRRAEKH